LNYNKKKLDEVNIEVEHFISLLKLVKEGKITPLKGKEILNKFYPKSFMPSAESGEKISDSRELKQIAEKVIKNNSKAVNDYKKGEQKAFDFLMGEIMKATQKRADFKIAREILQKLLNSN
jgi:aspartyl-tRNA(Asn)/glutamyl-tRNA(Gln) amidotransferase subunit B